jgi:hypothetical protein
MRAAWMKTYGGRERPVGFEKHLLDRGMGAEMAKEGAGGWAELLRKQADENAGDRGRYVSSKERRSRREAQAKERQEFLMDWNGRADEARRKSEQDKTKQNEKQEQDNANTLANISKGISSLQKLLTPIANAYKSEGT